jgi:3-oxoacyl-[acyl-carrier-protein] synthase II
VSAERKVVITGIGPVTPVGIGIDEFWRGLTAGRSGIRPITLFDTSGLPVTLAGEVEGFDPSAWLDAKDARRTGRFVQFAVAAAQLAWDDAGAPKVQSERTGVVFGTGIGGIEWLLNQHSVLQEKGPGRVSPFMVPALMANAAAGHVAMRFGFTGPNFGTVSACASGAHAIGEGFRLVRDGFVSPSPPSRR